jgi:hypothetical protein
MNDQAFDFVLNITDTAGGFESHSLLEFCSRPILGSDELFDLITAKLIDVRRLTGKIWLKVVRYEVLLEKRLNIYGDHIGITQKLLVRPETIWEN